MVKNSTAVPASALTQSVNADILNFSDTSDLESFHGVLGQDRAVNAIQFGVAMQRPGYNIFVMGDTELTCRSPPVSLTSSSLSRHPCSSCRP